MRSIIQFVLALCVLAGLCGADTPPQAWPRTLHLAEADITFSRPQIESWTGDSMKARMATVVHRKDQDGEISGTVWITASVLADFDAHQVTLYDIQLDKASFGGPVQTRRIEDTLKKALPDNPVTMPLKALTLAITEQTIVNVKSVSLGTSAPEILYSTSPAILLDIDGGPQWRPLASGLEQAINANRPLFRTTDDTTAFYLLLDKAWLTSTSLSTTFSGTTSLPSVFQQIPDVPQNKVIKAAVASPATGPNPVPSVLVSQRPAELVVVEGRPDWKQIPGTTLLYVTNTASDLFLETDTSRYVLLISGRWFQASEPGGPWTMVAASALSPSFKSIPPDAPKHRVLASIPGTLEAKDALVMAQIPQVATIKRGATVDVTWEGTPQFKDIKGLSITYGVNTPFYVLRVQGRYYCCYRAVWFTADNPSGPWSVCELVPPAIYDIPPSSPLYPVTYVKIYESNDTSVTNGFTAGYMGGFIMGSVLVAGTGYWYEPWYGSSAYYGWPATWGYGNWYNPWTGRYATTRGYVGPYGHGQAYNWSNPTTGWYGGGWQSKNPYHQWGANWASNGTQMVAGQHASGPRGSAGAIGTSWGTDAKWVNTRGGTTWDATRNGNAYAGHDGNVYRDDGSGWQKAGAGGWQSVQRPTTAPAASAHDAMLGGLNADRAGRTRARGFDSGTLNQSLGDGRFGGSGVGGAIPDRSGGGFGHDFAGHRGGLGGGGFRRGGFRFR